MMPSELNKAEHKAMPHMLELFKNNEAASKDKNDKDDVAGWNILKI